jgi:hypothetical protein
MRKMIRKLEAEGAKARRRSSGHISHPHQNCVAVQLLAELMSTVALPQTNEVQFWIIRIERLSAFFHPVNKWNVIYFL